MNTLLRAAALGAALLGSTALAAQAQTAPADHHGPMMQMIMAHHAPTLNLSAYGETKVAPDMATINFGVVTEAPTAEAAMAQNRERMNQVMAALRRAGIAERDIQTSGLNLSAQYDYVENAPPRLRGYQATNQVTVTVNDLTRVGSTADAVVSAGVNQIHGISFGLRDPSAAENAARQQAVRALRAKADLYAQATGHRIKGLKNLTEGGGYQAPPPMPMYRMVMNQAAEAATPVAPGQLTVRIDIQGIYELEQ